VGAVLTIACAAFIVRVLMDDWDQVSDLVGNASWAWLALALACAAVGMSIIALTWADALAVMGGRMRRGQALAWYYVGEIAKYLPGSIWAMVGRGEIARRRGVPAPQAYPSVFLSLIGLYLAAALSAAVLLPFDLAHSRDAGPALALLLLVPLGLAGLHPKVIRTVIEFAERVSKRSIPIRVPAWRASVLLVLRYVPAWVGIALATWCVALALPDVDAPLLRLSLATVLSWTAGFVTPSPGGAGVREAVFVAVSGLSSGPAVAVAVTARIIFVIVDVAGALIGAPFTGRRPRPADSVGSPASGPSPIVADEEG
jgi:uncharacterized membrane protein YbhN (UPF0104 family)